MTPEKPLRSKSQEFFDRVLMAKLTKQEIFELLVILDWEDDFREILEDFSRKHFPEDFEG